MFHRATLLVFSLTLLQAATPAYATGIETAPTFGKAFCTPTFSCSLVSDRDIDRSVTSQLVQNATSCVQNRLALQDSEGYFEESFGLDSNLCFTTKKMPASKGGLTMTPKCCIQPTPKNPDTCQIVCTKYGVR